MKHHLDSDLLPEKTTSVDQVLENILPIGAKLVTYDDWLKIDEVEKERGEKFGKIREKILAKDEMLAISHSKAT